MRNFILSGVLLIAFSFVPFTKSKASCQPGGAANLSCPYWNVTYEVVGGIFGQSLVKITCTTGGQFACETRGGSSK